MDQYVAIGNVRRAVRQIKRMNYRGEGWEAVHRESRRALKAILEGQMEAVRQGYLEDIASQGLSDRGNGHYRRRLLTTLGDLELRIPRTRHFSARGVLAAYARREPRVDRLILASFVLGVSTRKVAEALLPTLGQRVSASTVSRVAKSLDQAVAAFHRRPLKDQYQVLVLDGVAIRRRTGAGSLSLPVLVALGICRDGRKEILDFRVAPAESQAAWEAFLTDLYERGLKGTALELVATDGGAGLLAALPLVYPQVPEQRCWAHKTRNVLGKVKKADWAVVKRDLHWISHAENLRSARKAARRFADRWQDRYPGAVRCLRRDLEAMLQFFRYEDPEWRKATRTTNAIERRFREVRRRTRPMGAFADRTSVERILFAVFSRENQQEGTGAPFPLTQNT
jgi:putative transposase